MSEEPKKNKLAKVQQDNPGIFTGMSRTLRLVLHLVADKRVNFFLKLLPISTLVYLVSPLDAGIPAIDDAFVIGIGTYMFVELCPPDVVREHQERLAGKTTASETAENTGEIIDLQPTSDEDA
jgi:uncharacterized membrane protein YkvA (DUF1232 family)